MNNQMIEKIITSNNLPCPEFTFDNPLLDENVAEALSKSFVNILKMSEQNLKVNNNLRLSILENIRRMCQIEPESHIKINENITSALVEVYQPRRDDTITNPTDKILNEFLVRNIIDMNINSMYSTSLSPEVLQAMINLNKNQHNLNKLCEDVIHWNVSNKKNIHILKDLWSNGDIMIDDVSVKLKSEIEKMLLDLCAYLLSEVDCDLEELFTSNTDLKNLVAKSAVSATCFQLSCSILNYIFIMTNFKSPIQTLIQKFIELIKEKCVLVTISELYPIHLSYTVVLLDIDIEVLPKEVQEKYSQLAINHMHKLKAESETEFIMLLSHFPKWFDVIT